MSQPHDDALLAAIEAKNAQAAAAALDQGADPSAKTAKGKPALLLAIAKKSKRLVKLLIERGADVHATDAHGYNALYSLTDDLPEIDLVTTMLDRGVKPDQRSGEYAPLHRAAQISLDVADLLLERGASIDIATTDGITPLLLLLKSGEDDMNQGDIDAARWLLHKGARVDLADKRGFTALFHASRNGHDRALFDSLFEHGAKIHTDKYGQTPLHHAVGITSCRHDWVWKRLIRAGCDIDARDDKGETALHEATVSWNGHAVKFLLDHGADATIQSKDGKTALDLAQHYNQKKIIPLFQKAKPVAKPKAKTAPKPKAKPAAKAKPVPKAKAKPARKAKPAAKTKAKPAKAKRKR